MVKNNKTFALAAVVCLSIFLSARCVHAVVLYADDFDRGYWDQLVGNTSIGNYPWKDTDSDMNRIYEDALTIHGPGGYDTTYVQFDMDAYASYTVEFDFKVAAGLGTPPAFYFLPRNTSDTSIWYEWSVQN